MCTGFAANPVQLESSSVTVKTPSFATSFLRCTGLYRVFPVIYLVSASWGKVGCTWYNPVQRQTRYRGNRKKASSVKSPETPSQTAKEEPTMSMFDALALDNTASQLLPPPSPHSRGFEFRSTRAVARGYKSITPQTLLPARRAAAPDRARPASPPALPLSPCVRP